VTAFAGDARRDRDRSAKGCLQLKELVKDIIPVELIEKKIYLVRGQKVMLDRDLAELYR
jgi:hypothetical protein